MPPPIGDCDLACQTKIIIDGGLTGAVFNSTCQGFGHFITYGGKLKNAQLVLDALIKAEDAAFEFMRVLHEQTGYKGPWPNALKRADE